MLYDIGARLAATYWNWQAYNAVARASIDALIVLSLVALLLLARRRPCKIFDLWLSVVMFVWLCSVTLGNAIGTIRYDIGYDVSRIFAVLASTFILIWCSRRSAHFMRGQSASASAG